MDIVIKQVYSDVILCFSCEEDLHRIIHSLPVICVILDTVVATGIARLKHDCQSVPLAPPTSSLSRLSTSL